MSSLPTLPAASNAVPDPLCAETAYDAAKLHPAYRDVRAIKDEFVKLRNLCEQFTEKYHPDTIHAYLRNLGFRSGDLSEDFEHVHRDVLGAVWMLDILVAGIEPSLVLPFDLSGTGGGAAEKGGAA